jgi:23S rRNA (adenine-N6)-dimethyltransferase
MIQKKFTYSQNFIKSPQLIRSLIDKADIKLDDVVLDIGAGRGKITKELMKTSGSVTAYEEDRTLWEHLKGIKDDAEANPRNNLNLVFKNFLKTYLPTENYKVFSNIPFNQTARIVDKLFFGKNPPEKAWIFMQFEAARRYVGRPLGREMMLSVMLKHSFKVKIIHNFQPEDFTPPPGVEVVLVEFVRNENFDFKEYKKFGKFVKFFFNLGTPELIKALRKIFTEPQVQKMLSNFQIKRSATLGDIGIREWTEIYGIFNTMVDDKKKRAIYGIKPD